MEIALTYTLTSAHRCGLAHEYTQPHTQPATATGWLLPPYGEIQVPYFTDPGLGWVLPRGKEVRTWQGCCAELWLLLGAKSK